MTAGRGAAASAEDRGPAKLQATDSGGSGAGWDGEGEREDERDRSERIHSFVFRFWLDKKTQREEERKQISSPSEYGGLSSSPFGEINYFLLKFINDFNSIKARRVIFLWNI